MGATEVSMQLWRERELLELLLFKVDVQRLLLESQNVRFVHFATREVESVLALVRSAALSRDVEIAALGAQWGAPDASTLNELIAAAPSEAWREILGEHRSALMALMSELEHAKGVNVTYLRTASRAIADTLASVTDDAGEYSTTGERVREDLARIVDKTI
ncbi:flagellar export chaperone FlgN [Microbacterium sp. 77mftsu3.1]|uniref:flagellar export chaperone FlgN n=1 Tax=Microbacterium sp. 77mftsu3.1 TaxID=1761802 RepID=UPI000475E40F|nr:flagellar export chaperone FlgN [Microbacterium sp. 77mftsu3.1]SDH36884.1 FlgN protein [Microbacterium sp. 77mftsu3.1]